MPDSNKSSRNGLPRIIRLLRATLIVAAGGVLLVTVALPAGHAPTGIGWLNGLLQTGETRQAQTGEATGQNDTGVDAAAGTGGATHQPPAIDLTAPLPDGSLRHERVVTLAPNQAAEIKLRMSKGRKVRFSWETDGAPLNFNMHADSRRLKINYHPYDKGRDTRIDGELVAAFDGYHGWFWRNRSEMPVTVTLRTEGQYSEITRVK